MFWIRIVEEFAGLLETKGVPANFKTDILRKDLIQAGIGVRPDVWLSFCVTFSFFASSALSILAFYFTLSPIISMILFPSLIAALFFLLLKLPSYLKRKRAEEAERELSIALRSVVLLLKLGVPFEKILHSIAGGGHGALSGEFSRAHGNVIEGGAGVGEALAGIADRSDSALLKRAMAQMAFAYSHGYDSAALPGLADEMVLLQKTKAREHSSKMALLGLMFIGISCIVPALFAAYIIIGSSFLDLSFTPSDVHFAYLLLFPALAAAALLYIKEKTPKVIAS